jgi:hypothetical protein
MTQVIQAQQEIQLLDLTDPNYTDEEMVQILLTQGESYQSALRQVRWERYGIQRATTITTIVDGKEITFIAD